MEGFALAAEGALAPGRYARVHDRRRAIEAAIAAAGPGDVVLVAGKGHESTQTLGDRVLPFDDAQVASEVLEGGAR